MKILLVMALTRCLFSDICVLKHGNKVNNRHFDPQGIDSFTQDIYKFTTRHGRFYTRQKIRKVLRMIRTDFLYKYDETLAALY
jgi:hypothetical protein